MLSSYDAKSKSDLKSEDSYKEEGKINHSEGGSQKKQRKPRRLMTSSEKAKRRALREKGVFVAKKNATAGEFEKVYDDNGK